MSFMEDMLKFAEDMDEKEREEFLALAEQVDKEEDEYDEKKVIFLRHYRKRLDNKNYPDLDDFLLRNARIKLKRVHPNLGL